MADDDAAALLCADAYVATANSLETMSDLWLAPAVVVVVVVVPVVVVPDRPSPVVECCC